MFNKDLVLLKHTEISLRAGPGVATITLIKQADGYQCKLHAEANGKVHEASEEFGLSAGAIEKAKTIAPLLRKGLDLLELTQNSEREGFDVDLKVVDDQGNESKNTIRIPMSKGQLMQFMQLVNSLRAMNQDLINKVSPQ